MRISTHTLTRSVTYVSKYKEPVHASVSLPEYNTGKSIWKTKPGTMIRKVAKCQALREAFPNAYAGLYAAAEMGIADETLPTEPVQETSEAVVVQPEAAHKKPAEPAEPAEPIEVEVEELDGSDFLI